ncbi:calmodulin-binding protein 60 A-like isoform X2 [Lycium barbarum]|uniref:calmodulin-binding protein 60 A-like isoform X2 n=1 Tax=Lycium barbarum TaxID=112863 RepID=UPI00293E9C7C|nr:calmodulin-binding protein 60 A-like isoform X2 [Lycium barbarum]
MAHNTVFEDGNNAGEGNNSSHTGTTNSTPPFTRAIRDVVSLCKLRRIVVGFLLALFPNFPVVAVFQFDLKLILTARNRNSQKNIHPSERKCLLLNFSHKIAPVVFTGEYIFPKGTKLELVDAVTGQQVRHGPLASAQVEIFLLNGDENGTIQDLNSRIMMRKRGGKSGRPKNPYLRLQEGAVSVAEVIFKHTPKHMKKLKVVRLGARVVDQPEEIKVIEAVIGTFTVKDKRLRSKKRYPPSPTDDVWRLKQISRDGAFHSRLTENGIKTVEDFLIELHNNPQRLRRILGKNMSHNSWNTATRHSMTCNLDGRKYLYYHMVTEQKAVVVFNVAGQLIWLDSGCGLHHFYTLSESQKAYARKLVESAFANWENVLKFDSEISVMDHLSSSKFSPSSCPAVDDFQHTELQLTSSHLIQRTAESNQCVVKAECSTSNAIADRQSESDEISFAITSPGHSGLGTWGYLGSPNDITSVILDSGDWEKIMQFLCSDAIELEDSPHGEPGQVYHSADETCSTQFNGLQHDESLDLSQNQFTHLVISEDFHTVIHEDGTNANQWTEMNDASMVPMASMCKGKSKKSWTKISSILKWFLLKRSVKLKNICITREQKFSR